MSAQFVALAVVYIVGFAVCLPIAYRWLVNDPDGTPEFHANATGAFGFALGWFIFLPVYYTDRRQKINRRASA